MGCSAVSKHSLIISKEKPIKTKTPFPLSYYEKCLIKDLWIDARDLSLELGLNIFHKLFLRHPDLIQVFPEFGNLKEIDEILTWSRLDGHPLKIFTALDRAVMSLDDGDVFIQKMEKLGMKHHENSLQPEYLTALGEAIIEAFRKILGKELWNIEVEKAWKHMYDFICKVMKSGLEQSQTH